MGEVWLKKYTGLHAKHPSFLSDLKKLSQFPRQILGYSNVKFHENPLGAELFHVDRRTDTTKLIVAIRNFANTPKNYGYLYLTRL